MISVRKLVALDITLHGRRFILLEFGVGTPAILLFGSWLILVGQPLVGWYLTTVGVNYLPLLAYGIVIGSREAARGEVEEDMNRDKRFVRGYGTKQMLLLVPFAVAILALVQLVRPSKPT